MLVTLEDFRKGARTSAAAVTQLVLFGNLVDMMKIEKQRDFRTSYRTIFSKYSKEGIIRANRHGIIPGAIMYGVRGMVYGTSFITLERYFNATTHLESCGVSALAGFTEGCVSAPLALMRVRISENVTQKTKPSFSVLQTLRTSPLNGLKRGSDWGLRTFLVQKYLDVGFNEVPAAFAAGVTASIISMPIDRLIPLVQQKNPPKNLIRWIMSQSPRSLFAGSAMRLLNSGMNSLYVMTAMKFVYISKY